MSKSLRLPDTKRLPLIAVALTAALFFINHLTQLPPAVVPASAPDEAFSAERAFAVLSTLLAEEVPHPVGSPQNRIVRQRIIDELTRLGIGYEEQNSWTCGEVFANCAYVENIIGIIPGRSTGNAIALMAHYDSVPMAPGAGDDGAGVAAILESARALIGEAPFEHPIFLLITDGEEMGLIGAEAFFRQHPRASEVGVVLNYEGSGTTGASLVLRTNAANEMLIDTLVDQTSSPYGFSFAAEIFERMPNDTDFSVPLAMDIPGIDFAFAGERKHYHTPNDNLSNIDLRTIQHHGENMLPLVRSLADADLSDLGGRVVYGTAYDLWLQWLTDYSLFLLLLSFVLLAFVCFRLRPQPLAVLKAVFFHLGIIAAVCSSGVAAFLLLQFLLGTGIDWPAFHTPFRLLLVSSCLSGGLLLGGLANRKCSQFELLLAGWLLWALLSLLLVIYLADAAFVLLLPTLAAALLLAVATLVDEEKRPCIYLLTLVLALPTTLGVVYALEQSQGYRLIFAVLPFIALYLVVLAPLLQGVDLIKASRYSAIASLLLILVISFIPLYSQFRPQMVNINYFESVDAETAYYQLSAPNPVQGELREAMNFSAEERALLSFSESTLRHWAEVEPSGLPGMEMTVLNAEQLDEGRRLDIDLRSPREADSVRVLVPQDAGLASFELGGNRYEAPSLSRGLFAGFHVISVFGVYERTVPLTLELDSAEVTPLYLIDISTELPATGAELLVLRQGLLSPVHRGDQAFLIRRVTL